MTKLWTGILCLLAAGSPAVAQNEHLKRLDWLIGTWEGEGKMDGMTFDATLTCKWTLHKKFIKTSYQATAGGQVVWKDEGMIGWDSEKKTLVEFTFGMDGSIGWGKHLGSKEKDTWVVQGSIPGPSPFKDFRSTMKKTGPNSFTTTVKTKKGDKYVEFFSAKYKRKSAKQPKK